MAIEIVDFPIKMVIFHSYVNVYQRVDLLKTHHFTPRATVERCEGNTFFGSESPALTSTESTST